LQDPARGRGESQGLRANLVRGRPALPGGTSLRYNCLIGRSNDCCIFGIARKGLKDGRKRGIRGLGLIEMVEAVADLHLPPRADQRLQDLMDRNNNGALTPEEREQLEALVELSEAIAIVRAQALHLLKRSPQ